MIVRTKICGIRNFDELSIAQNSGVDAIGLLVGQHHAAVGFISTEQANDICIKANPFISTVIVTHHEAPSEICDLANKISATTIQIHSDISIDSLLQIKNQIRPIKIICKVSVIDNDSITRAKSLFTVSDAILLDTYDKNTDQVGGTGKVHDWNISSEISRISPIPVILAGGLNPFNVKKAIDTVRPWGVDCNSGVRENQILQKSLADQFVREAKLH